MDLLTNLISIIGGSLAGLFTSLYIWDLDRKKSLPRLVIQTENNNPIRPNFKVVNTGPTHALNIVVSDQIDKRVMINCKELQPNGIEEIVCLNEDEQMTIIIEYTDVWNKKYRDIWKIEGPTLAEYSSKDSDNTTTITRIPFRIEHL